MLELSDLVLTFWKKSKSEWQENKHKLYGFAVVLVSVYLVLEATSYIFAQASENSKTKELIRMKFMDKRVALSNLFVERLYGLKEQTRFLLIEVNSKNYNPKQCNTLLNELNIKKNGIKFIYS